MKKLTARDTKKLPIGTKFTVNVNNPYNGTVMGIVGTIIQTKFDGCTSSYTAKLMAADINSGLITLIQ